MTAVWPKHFRPEVVRQAFGGGKLTSHCLALEAWRRGLQVTFYDGDLRTFEIWDRSKRVKFNDSRPISITRPADYRKLIRKWETKRLLEDAGVPVPEGRLLDSSTMGPDKLKEIAAEIGYPVVIKPNDGTMGRGVFSNLASWEQLDSSWAHLVNELKVKQILIERHYSGDDYRILVVGDRVLAACQRVPANVQADGVQSVEQLIASKNRTRKQNPFLSKGIIRVDYEVRQELASQGLTLASTPESGSLIYLRRIANASAGGDVIDVTDELPDPIKQAAIQAVTAIPNIVVAGVDVLYQSGAPATRDTFTVIEMNSRPHIPVNMYPTEGQGQDVPGKMIDYFFPESPRLEHPGNQMLNFNVRPFRAALRENVVDSMTVKPLPSHHYPIRRKIAFDNPSEQTTMTEVRAISLQKRARQLGVSGLLARRGRQIELILAAADEQKLQPVIAEVKGLLNMEATSDEEWHGVTTAGFRVALPLPF